MSFFSKEIIVSCATLGCGGAERVLSILSKPLADSYGKVTYVMWVKAPVFYDIDKRVRLICIEDEINSQSDIKKILWFRKYIRNESPDLILSFLVPYNLRVLMSLLGVKSKVIVAERNDPRAIKGGNLMGAVRNLIYLKAKGIIVQTQTGMDYFKGALKRRTSIIYNPIHISSEWVGKSLSAVKRKRIVSIGRLEPHKRHDLLIRAFAGFCKTHRNYTLDIYGEGPEKGMLQQMIADEGMEGKAFLKGRCNAVIKELLDAEIFVLVSTHEGMSNAMIEAMSLGLPCICTKVSGAVDLIESGKNGILIDIDDEKALLDALNRIADDNNLSFHLGNEASSVYEKLKEDIIIPQWLTCLRDV